MKQAGNINSFMSLTFNFQNTFLFEVGLKMNVSSYLLFKKVMGSYQFCIHIMTPASKPAIHQSAYNQAAYILKLIYLQQGLKALKRRHLGTQIIAIYEFCQL